MKFIRHAAFILIPCMIMDPVTAAAFELSAIVVPIPINCIRLNQDALAGRDVPFTWGQLGRGLLSRWTQDRPLAPSHSTLNAWAAISIGAMVLAFQGGPLAIDPSRRAYPAAQIQTSLEIELEDIPGLKGLVKTTSLSAEDLRPLVPGRLILTLTPRRLLDFSVVRLFRPNGTQIVAFLVPFDDQGIPDRPLPIPAGPSLPPDINAMPFGKSTRIILPIPSADPVTLDVETSHPSRVTARVERNPAPGFQMVWLGSAVWIVAAVVARVWNRRPPPTPSPAKKSTSQFSRLHAAA